MSDTLKGLLIIASVLTVGWILRKIRKNKVKMEDAIFWIFFAAILLLLAIFPEISYELCRRFGIMSPSNLVFLVIIFLLVEKIFTLSIIVSQLEDKIGVLSAEVALRSKAENKKIDKVDEKETLLEREEVERGRNWYWRRKMTNGFLENHSSNLYSPLWGIFCRKPFSNMFWNEYI